MLRIFVTGDNHIGLKYASHSNACVLSEARTAAFVNMVKCAQSEGCSLFVITGDLFENNNVSKKSVKLLTDILSSFNGTVVVLPGNHDYYDEDTNTWRYFRDITKDTDNILLLNEFRPYTLDADGEEVVLYPALCKSMHSKSGENNLGWIKNEGIIPDDSYRIGVAHGAVEGETIDREGHYFLMKRSELEAIPVDAWLIGHTHVPFPGNLSDSEFIPCERIFNAGTHVQTDVSCNCEGQCFIIEIDENKNIRAKKYISGPLRFYRKYISLNAGNAFALLENELRDIPDSSVVDLILTGALTAEEYEGRAAVLDAMLSRFIEGSYNDHALSKLLSKELIESEFPETSLSARLLTELLPDPKDAQLAYELLKELKGGK
ncbi:MAG: metallophosphoesterase [Clostridia bacterium]|nr:metallophosphoesterase [Clostridia bacterium]